MSVKLSFTAESWNNSDLHSKNRRLRATEVSLPLTSSVLAADQCWFTRATNRGVCAFIHLNIFITEKLLLINTPMVDQITSPTLNVLIIYLSDQNLAWIILRPKYLPTKYVSMYGKCRSIKTSYDVTLAL